MSLLRSLFSNDGYWSTLPAFDNISCCHDC